LFFMFFTSKWESYKCQIMRVEMVFFSLIINHMVNDKQGR
jgi:hypothetical protein